MNENMETEDEGFRKPADIYSTIQLAKLDPANILQPSQILQFDNEASNDKYMLIELNDKLVKEIEDGNSLVIRGYEDDTAILCSDEATYDVKRAGISNVLLLAENCATSKDDLLEILPLSQTDPNLHAEFKVAVKYQNIAGWANTYLELKEILPCTSRILKLLKQNPYCGEVHEDAKKPKYTLSELLDIVQASEKEIVEGLMKIKSCCINGYWRVLDFVYIVDCMGEIFKLIDAESWPLDEIPVNEVCEKINDCGELVPEFIVKHLMTMYGHRKSASENIYELDEENVCQFFAEMLLYDVEKFSLSEFIETWKESLPGGIVPCEAYLQGLALIDRDSQPPCIYMFRLSDLPQDVNERFNALFSHRKKWREEDIIPYVTDLLRKDQSVASLLLRHARSSMNKGIKYYNSRKIVK